MNGLINVLKPPGMTSHDVVGVVRRLTGAKVGHTGTLDPLAAGVLVLTVGAATRLSELIISEGKSYRAEFVLGLETDTLDLEGKVLAERPAGHISRHDAAAIMAEMTGEIDIVPPMFSAIKQRGRKLYELAREGKDVPREPRKVSIARFDLLEFRPGETPHCLCLIECSKGTYVRSLAQMIGEALGCGGCLGFLLRTAQGQHRIEDSFTLEELTSGGGGDALIPLQDAIPDIPHVAVDETEARGLRHGNAIPALGAMHAGDRVMITFNGEAMCLAEVVGGPDGMRLQPRKVFAT